MLVEPPDNRVRAWDLPLQAVFQGMQVGAKHILNPLDCSLGSPIAGALAGGTGLRHQLKYFFIRSRVSHTTDLFERGFQCCANSWLLVRLIHKFRDTTVLQEFCKPANDIVTGTFDVASRAEDGMAWVKFPFEPRQEVLVRLTDKTLVSYKDWNGPTCPML